LTGRTYLAGFSNNMSEYQALMDNGIQYAKSFSLTPGIGLTAEQMAQLTTDMVWLVSQDVTLPNGSRQSVLVPKVYLAQSNAVDLKGTGALVAGGSVYQHATGDVNNSGRIVGDLATQVVGSNIVNRGQIGNAGTTLVAAQQDVRNLGGRISGTDTLVSAGRDVINDSGGAIGAAVNAGNKVSSASRSQDGRAAALWGVAAGRDAYDAGTSMLANGGNPLAGAAVTLSFGSSRSKQTFTQDGATYAGSQVKAGGAIVLQATGQDANGNATAGNLDIVGSDISGRQVALRAKNDVNIVSATETDASRSTNQSSSASVGVSYGAQGFGVSASASKSKGNSDSTSATEVNSRISGTDSVSVVSGKDTNIQGATVSGGRVTANVGGTCTRWT